MGMGFPVGMGFPWDSHGNGNIKHICMGMGMGMGMISVGVGMSKKYMAEKFPFALRFIILFMYHNFLNASEIEAAFGLLP